jgi:hypothetical protein
MLSKLLDWLFGGWLCPAPPVSDERLSRNKGQPVEGYGGMPKPPAKPGPEPVDEGGEK